MSRPHVAIVGAGFGGLFAARELAKSPHVRVTLIDKNNYHTFLPLLYQVAAAELKPEDIAIPIRKIIQAMPNIAFSLGTVTNIDPVKKAIETLTCAISYDYLILSMGSDNNFFGIEGADRFAFPLKDMEDAIAIRNHTLEIFELACCESDPDKRRKLLTFVIVGAGATGIEFAGAFSELIFGPMIKDFPEIDFKDVKIILIDSRDKLLSDLPLKLSSYASRRLTKMKIDVRSKMRVTKVAYDGVHLNDGSVIGSDTIIWAAGVKGLANLNKWGIKTAEKDSVPVLPTLQVSEYPNIYAVGDSVVFKDNGIALPQTGPVAIQQGIAAARNIIEQISGGRPKNFKFRDEGFMLVTGRNAGVVRIGNFTFTGVVAWFLWLFLHLYSLMGFSGKIKTIANWGWNYLFFQNAVRVILPKCKRHL